MRALVLQFEQDCPADHLGDLLIRQRVFADMVRMYLPHAPLSLKSYDMVIALGGGMNVDEDARYPFLTEAKNLIGEAMYRNLPILGICLGGQMLARTRGASVSRMKIPEIGVVPITRQAVNDPLLVEIDWPMSAIQFHEDSFNIPPGGQILASSSGCPTQIVRCGHHAYALQFHPEVSLGTFTTWARDSYERMSGDTDPLHLQELIANVRTHYGELRRSADTMLTNFIRLSSGASVAN